MTLSFKSTTYDSGKPGKTIGIFGAIHGNESCGTRAIQAFMQDLDSGKIVHETGKIIFVPVCNPAAAALNQRFVDEDLNRKFWPVATPHTNEESLRNRLCALIDGMDALLDIHSFHAHGAPFIFATGPAHERAFYESLGPRIFVSGWSAAAGATDPTARADSDGTSQYARKHPRQIVSATIECGQHTHTRAINVAYSAIANSLAFYGLISPLPECLPDPNTPIRDLLMLPNSTLKRDSSHANVRFAKPFENITPVQAGEAILLGDDGTILTTAPRDCMILFPKITALTGESLYSLCVDAKSVDEKNVDTLKAPA